MTSQKLPSPFRNGCMERQAAMKLLTRIPPSDQWLHLLQWHFPTNWALHSGDECFTNSMKVARAHPLTDDNATEQFALRGTRQIFVQELDVNWFDNSLWSFLLRARVSLNLPPRLSLATAGCWALDLLSN